MYSQLWGSRDWYWQQLDSAEGPWLCQIPAEGISVGTHIRRRKDEVRREARKRSQVNLIPSQIPTEIPGKYPPLFSSASSTWTLNTINLPLFLKDSTISALLHWGKTQPEQYPIEGKSFMKMAAGPEDCLLSFYMAPLVFWGSSLLWICCASICPGTQLSDLTVLLFSSLHLPALFMQLKILKVEVRLKRNES